MPSATALVADRLRSALLASVSHLSAYWRTSQRLLAGRLVSLFADRVAMSAFRFPGKSFFPGRTRRGAALISSVWLRIVAARTPHSFQVLSAFFRFFQVPSGVAVGTTSADGGADEELDMALFLSCRIEVWHKCIVFSVWWRAVIC